MKNSYNILIFGASYGSLLATKLILAGHTVKLVCLLAEAELINKDGTRVLLPIIGREKLVEIDSRKLPGMLSATTPDSVNTSDYDLIVLAMQEPQYRSPEVYKLLNEIANKNKPCLSIMNMPPLSYLIRIPNLDNDTLKQCYTDHTVWDRFDPKLITLASPDPQAFRPPEEGLNVLQVGLPTNFKVARFDSDEHNKILIQIENFIITK